jgi:hypothetical protein
MIRMQQPYLNRSAYRRRWMTRAAVSSAHSIGSSRRRGGRLVGAGIEAWVEHRLIRCETPGTSEST